MDTANTLWLRGNSLRIHEISALDHGGDELTMIAAVEYLTEDNDPDGCARS